MTFGRIESIMEECYIERTEYERGSDLDHKYKCIYII